MMLALDIGNSHVYAGLFDGDRLRAQFRMNSKGSATSDEIGLFLRSALRENGVEPTAVQEIAVCTVVPDMLHSIRGACRKYFNAAPFVLEPGVRTGLQIKYRNPLEVGPDRIANAVAATHLFPGKDLLIIDFGTATTFCAVSRDREYLGGTILAGMRIAMEALESRTARLPKVEIVVPEQAIARSTVESIQAGLYFGTLGAVRELTERATRESFGGERPWVIGTGGFSSLFEATGVFDALVADLVLKGLWLSYRMNH